MKMGAKSEVLGHWLEEISTDWEQIRSWAQSLLTRERIAGIALLASTVTLWAALLFYLYNAFQNYTIVEVSPYLSSLNWQMPVPGH
jgi:hypothetical protein